MLLDRVYSKNHSFIHRLDTVWAHVLLRVICNFLYHREVLLRRIEMVHSDLVHSYVHYWRMRAMPVMVWEIWVIYRWCATLGATAGVLYDTTTILLLHFLCWLEDGR